MLSTGPTAVLAAPDRLAADRPEAKEPEASDGRFAGLMAQFVQATPQIQPDQTEAPVNQGDAVRPEALTADAPPSGPQAQIQIQAQAQAPSAQTPVVTKAEETAGMPAPEPATSRSAAEPAPVPALPAPPEPAVPAPADSRTVPGLSAPTRAKTEAPLEATGRSETPIASGFTDPYTPAPPIFPGVDGTLAQAAQAPVPAGPQLPAVLAVALPRSPAAKVEPSAKVPEGATPEPVSASPALLDLVTVTPAPAKAPTPQPDPVAPLQLAATATTPMPSDPTPPPPAVGPRPEVPDPGLPQASKTPDRAVAAAVTETASAAASPAPQTADQVPLKAVARLLPQPEVEGVRAVAPGHPEATALTAAGAQVPPTTRIAAQAPAAPLAPAHTPMPPPASPVTQVDGGLRWMLKGGAQEARLQLHPESLGQVTIHLKVEGGEVQARLWITEPASVRVVQEGRAHLEQSLKEQGLQLGSFDLQQGHRPFQEAPSAPAFRDRAQPLVPLTRQEAPAAPSPSILNPHHVELYA